MKTYSCEDTNTIAVHSIPATAMDLISVGPNPRLNPKMLNLVPPATCPEVGKIYIKKRGKSNIKNPIIICNEYEISHC